MATTTTHYGFDIPQSTDLVKDGATAIATLGQDIDTAMNTALGTKKSGLVLLNTTSFSGVASQSVNSVFSSTYRNYFLMCDITAATTTGSLTLKLRASGVDTSTNYKSNRAYAVTTSIGANGDVAGTDEWYLTQTRGTVAAEQDRTLFQMDIYRPNLAAETMFVGRGLFFDADTYQTIISGNQTDATQFDGFTIIATGNITGSVSVFGYNS